VKKLLATIFAAPGTVRVSSRGVTVQLMPATESERLALRAFLHDVTPSASRCPAIPTAAGCAGCSRDQ
jgi:hypothetical protein